MASCTVSQQFSFILSMALSLSFQLSANEAQRTQYGNESILPHVNRHVCCLKRYSISETQKPTGCFLRFRRDPNLTSRNIGRRRGNFAETTLKAEKLQQKNPLPFSFFVIRSSLFVFNPWRQQGSGSRAAGQQGQQGSGLLFSCRRFAGAERHWQAPLKTRELASD